MVWAGAWLVLLLVLLGAAVVLAGLRGAGGGSGGPDGGQAHEMLRRRLAAGEIDEREYRERAELLGGGRGAGSPIPRWAPVALVGLAGLLLIGLLLGTGGFGGGWWGQGGRHMDGMMGPRTTDAGGPSGLDAPAPVPDARGLTVEAGEMWFDPDVLELTAGEPVNLAVDNRGELFHDLTVDDLDLRIEVPAGGSATAGLEVAEPGEYDFYCSVPGHASAGMHGTLVVTAAG
jgi:plastocyanin